MKIKTLGDIEVSVEKHPRKNQVKGVFYDREDLLESLSNKEVTEGLQQWNPEIPIVSVERIGKVGRNWKIIMECLKVPRRIKVGVGLACNVDIFVPNPLRCSSVRNMGIQSELVERRTLVGAKDVERNMLVGMIIKSVWIMSVLVYIVIRLVVNKLVATIAKEHIVLGIVHVRSRNYGKKRVDWCTEKD